MMKYVMLGTLNRDWLARQKERTAGARKKLDELGIKLEALYYTQGEYDFVDIADAPDVEAILAFSVWYAAQGYGRITTLPAFTEAQFDAAVAKA
ncbi:MAG: GYD domain-containing protein [Alphaproteobacteria bacterium]|nr:GYD domain-containing protein [Alphaproteobacteria bacterium]